MIKYLKTRDVKSPTRGTPLSAGIDLYIPNDFTPTEIIPQWFLACQKCNNFIVEKRKTSILIPSGIRVEFPPEYALIAMNKSGVSSKKGMIKGAELIDADYSGELHIHLINVGEEIILLSPGEKIIQVMLVKTAYLEPVEVQETELWTKESERGPNGFGSTGI